MAPHLSVASNHSFAGLAGAQFLDAFNDNLFKMVVSLFAVGVLADENDGSYLSLSRCHICFFPAGPVSWQIPCRSAP